MEDLKDSAHYLLGKIKLPWRDGLSLLCTASFGSQGSMYHCDNYNAYYALDFDRPWEGNIEPETEILAIADGKIESICVDPYDLLGLHIKILHVDRISSLYAHLKEIDRGIYVGAEIKQGMIVGFLGETGKAAGPHLHFQLLVEGKCLEEIKETRPEPISGYRNLKPNQWYKSDNRLLILDC